MRHNWFASEEDFSKWLQARLKEQRFHVQSFDEVGDGVPDLNAGGGGIEAWMELKLSRRITSVHELIQLDHPLLISQYWWLKERQRLGNAKCAVVVAWRTNAGQYVSFIPIEHWKERIGQTLMTWGLCAYTTTIGRLGDGADRVSDLLSARRWRRPAQRGVRT